MAPTQISGNGKQVRDVLHAKDCVSLYLSASQNINNIRGEAFNIGGGQTNSMSLLELFNFVGDELGVEIEYETLAARESDQLVFVSDTTKLESFLPWQAKISKFDGIRLMIDWIKDAKPL